MKLISLPLTFSSKSYKYKINFRHVPEKQHEHPLKPQYVIRSHQNRECFFLMAMPNTET